jgi:hypothetical protein
MYIPPKGSPYIAYNIPLFAVALQLIRRGALSHDNEIIICLDANSRISCILKDDGVALNIRHTLDGEFINTRPFLTFLAAAKLSPLHGRDISHAAQTTSRLVTGRQVVGKSEVDFILGPQSWGYDRFSLLPMIPWNEVPKWSSHRPLLVEIALLRTNSPLASEAPVRQPRWRTPYYNDKQWGSIALNVTKALTGDGPDANTLKNDDSSGVASLNALTRIMESALDKLIPVRPIQTAEQRHGAFSNKRTKAARLNRAKTLPREVVDKIEASRSARKTAKHDPNDLAKREAARIARNTSTHAIRAHHRRHHDDWKRDLHKLRTNDAHKFYEDIKRKLAPEEPTLHNPGKSLIPSENGQASALERFTRYFSEQFENEVPIVPGVSDPNWMNLLPHHPEPRLSRPYTGAEFISLLYPSQLNGVHICPSTGYAEGTCPMCTEIEARRGASLGRFDILHSSPLQGMSSLNAAAACSGDLNGKHFRWPHSSGNSDITRQFRQETAEALATTLNRVIAERSMPAAAVENLVVYILKNARDKAEVNNCDPDFYRPIAMSTAITKIWGLAILNRLSHWVRTHNIVETSSQGAFTMGVGGIWHVWSMRESIRSEWHHGRDVYVTFFDLSKAYDKVDPRALCAMLRRLGVPKDLVDFLLNWALSRTSRVSINGELSEPMRVFLGVGQGETTSPLFFDIFISLLARYIASLPNVAGIDVNGCTIKILMFADDLTSPTNNASKLQAVVDAVNKWANAWGMKVNTKTGKTESMALYHPRSRFKNEVLPIITSTDAEGNTTVVKWTKSYRYLGFPMTPDLKTDLVIDSLYSKMRIAYGRLFGYNKLITKLDMQSMGQLFKTFVIGSIQYLLPIIDINDKAISEINKTIFKFIRSVFKLGSTFPNILIAMDGGIPSAHALLLRARVSLALNLESSQVLDAPAVALFKSISSQPLRRTDGLTASWPHAVAHLLATNHATLGATPPAPPDRFSIPSSVGAYARLIEYLKLRQKAIADGYNLRDVPTIARPREVSRTQHVLDLAFGLSQAGQLGLCAPATPLSIWGPLCSGSLLHKTTITSLVPTIIPALANARLGLSSLYHKTVAPSSWEGKFYDRESGAMLCTACNMQQLASPWHIINECNNAIITSTRNTLRKKATTFVKRLVTLCADAAKCGHPFMLYACNPAAAAAMNATVDWDTPLGMFLLFRLCLVLPFPASVVPANDWHNDNLVLQLGRVFDSIIVRAHALRPIANSWVLWGGNEYLDLLKIWACEVDKNPAHNRAND